VRGVLRPESKQAYLNIVDRMRTAGAEGVILGCTEIFLLISQPDRPDFPMFNTTSLHVEAAVDFALRETNI
jgi:aspartate racemase